MPPRYRVRIPNNVRYARLVLRNAATKLQNNCCMWCGDDVTELGKLYPGIYRTLEHVVPAIWGGEDSELNCGMACNICNEMRNTGKGSDALEVRALLALVVSGVWLLDLASVR